MKSSIERMAGNGVVFDSSNIITELVRKKFLIVITDYNTDVIKKMVDKFKKHTDDAKNIMKSFSPNNVLNKSFVNKVNGLS